MSGYFQKMGNLKSQRSSDGWAFKGTFKDIVKINAGLIHKESLQTAGDNKLDNSQQHKVTHWETQWHTFTQQAADNTDIWRANTLL